MYQVMLVDDREIFRRQICRLDIWGPRSGFEIAWQAKDGLEAWEIMQREKVDLLLTDIRMPRMDGIELIKRAGEEGLSCPSIILSDYREFEMAQRALRQGVLDYLVKPVQEEKLLEVLKKIALFLEGKEETKPSQGEKEKALWRALWQTLFSTEGRARDIAQLLLVHLSAEGSDLKDKLIHRQLKNHLWKGLVDRAFWLTDFLLFVEKKSLEGELPFPQMVQILEEKIALLSLPWIQHPLLRRLINHVLSQADLDLRVGQLAQDFHLSSNYLGDLFKKESGMTLQNYLQRVRYMRACALLSQPQASLQETADRLGYASVGYFSKAFKKQLGQSPSRYQKACQKKEKESRLLQGQAAKESS